ncbi:M23 family metallopeptidase [Nocardioides sp.]|uniref:M23 family metallopeptidase n=1 Tax=Nocardioides sp. TaxID=35761 RepID=UPI002BB119EF|nr:M23 family metallopeptidase [Nocardioides sp.]HVX53111.1 M23 family metallopeptidase [Nocardioides sp.]
MRPIRYAAVAAVAAVLLAGCGTTPSSTRTSPGAPGTRTTAAEPAPVPSTPIASPSTTPTTPAATPSSQHREAHPDPRWRFYTADGHWYSSPWFAGTHRIMIGFGCNASPWYDHDPACPGTEGFHHGIDVAMPCGTVLRAGLAGTVLPPDAPGTPGPAYGVHPFRIRIEGPGGPHDVLIGHARTVFVHPGDRVAVGQRIALASDSGAPDGCHLHFEVRPPGGAYRTAVDPARWLRLSRA